MSENFLILQIFHPKVQNMGPKLPHNLEKFRGKIETLSTHSLRSEIWSVCRKIVTFCPAYFFNPQRH